MRDPGKISAAIEVLADFEKRRVPLKVCLADWARGHRFAGAKDRAWISGLCLDVLRCKHSLGYLMKDDTPRARALGALRFSWGWDLSLLAQCASEEPHGPGALSEAEEQALASDGAMSEVSDSIAGDYPDWLAPSFARVFDDPVAEAAAFTQRAPIDLRVNSLKADSQKALKSLGTLGGEVSDLLINALRLPAPESTRRAGAVETIPSYGKGWVEVQDLGSQIAAAAAGDLTNCQVLDFCAGAGGKTLALSAMAQNKGQIFAWDADGRRLAPIFERIRRAGARNIQVRSPADGGTLADLVGKMDLVFVDAPCTGTGTWRRRPDTKWRLTKSQLETRMKEQDDALSAAAPYVKPGGKLVYVTCSFLAEENEDRLAAFRTQQSDFTPVETLAEINASGQLAEGAMAVLEACKVSDGALRLTPKRCGTDGFFVSVLQRAAE